jgi:Transposase
MVDLGVLCLGARRGRSWLVHAGADKKGAMPMAMSCGIDWAEGHHDVAVVDADGRLVAKRRIGDDAAGMGSCSEVLAEAGDRPETPIPVAIEPRGACWWPACAPVAVRCMRSSRWRWACYQERQAAGRGGHEPRGDDVRLGP